MSDLYVHGLVLNRSTGEVQEFRSPATDVVGAAGTAPQSKVLKAGEPMAFLGKEEALEAVYPKGSTGTDKGTLYDAIVGVQEQGTARIVLIKAESESVTDMQKAINAFPLSMSATGYMPKILLISGAGNFNPKDPPAPAPAFTPSTESSGTTANSTNKTEKK